MWQTHVKHDKQQIIKRVLSTNQTPCLTVDWGSKVRRGESPFSRGGVVTQDRHLCRWVIRNVVPCRSTLVLQLSSLYTLEMNKFSLGNCTLRRDRGKIVQSLSFQYTIEVLLRYLNLLYCIAFLMSKDLFKSLGSRSLM